MKLSFVIPCYNSEKTIQNVVQEIQDKMTEMKEDSYEIILVNDHSKDKTKEAIFELADKKECIISLDLSKNFGQHSALMAGYNFASGEIIISLDDDGQTPANQVDLLLNKLEEGFDAVYANYKHKRHSWFRNFGSKVNDYMAYKLVDKPKDIYLASYFVAKKFVIDEVIKYDGGYPYIPGLVLRITKNMINVDVDHRSREIGESGYTFSKLLKLWMNGFTAFSVKPLRISIYLGIVIAFLGFALAFYAVISKLLNPTILIGWTSLISVVSIIGGTIIMILGMIGEYVGRIYISINKNPQYVIKEMRKKK